MQIGVIELASHMRGVMCLGSIVIMFILRFLVHVLVSKLAKLKMHLAGCWAKLVMHTQLSHNIVIFQFSLPGLTLIVGLSTFNWTTYELQVSFMARIHHLYLKNTATEVDVLTRKDVLPFERCVQVSTRQLRDPRVGKIRTTPTHGRYPRKRQLYGYLFMLLVKS
ncbi:hypothetical protein GIB67_010162 [Kingdonia uniflora]|uniref:Uncharacterized protein n=1 Tax=Kingdonia uniflora TaxID=39325 RepID=A0A7J7NB47_9MAGN|nr:hypothetical protein GIB67_010162 [Kingdonia uniflora]